jgi:hypothetical protein
MVNYVQCTATSKRTHQRCKARAVTGSTVCYHHGGKTPRGADSPHFKTGIYSSYASARIKDKIGHYIEADPFDLTNELALTRALLADYLQRFDGIPLDASSIDLMTILVDRVRKTVETIVKIRNDSALTAAEVTYLASRIVGLLDRYIDDPAKREACKLELLSFTVPTDRSLIAQNE